MDPLLILVIGAVSTLTAFGQGAEPDNKPLPVTFSLTGSEMYKTWCATCHGALGKGDGPTASELKTQPADLTQLAKKNGGKFPIEKVRNHIDGTATVAAHGSREMPVWGTFFQQLGDDKSVTYRIVTLANYVESLQAK
ncbi:MAG TPA: c-type cytochrome [Bryobacteraceae bacterium]|nr:c-type cytochrome [Bryobacteraceae bacterium]